MGFTINKAHGVDVSGKTRGSISCDATSLDHEGVVISSVKLAKAGRFRERVLNGFLEEVRNPDTSKGDLRAAIAAANLGERRVLELVV